VIGMGGRWQRETNKAARLAFTEGARAGAILLVQARWPPMSRSLKAIRATIKGGAGDQEAFGGC